MNSMALQESQLNVLARDLKNPALQAKRVSLTPLQVQPTNIFNTNFCNVFYLRNLNIIVYFKFQAEHNMQKQMLETLQQDHMQINIKHNIGV